jgi:hypothetical protein
MLSLISLPVIGFLAGFLIISLGGGGGLIYVGVLTAFFHITPAVAASTSLATIIPSTAAGTLSHWKSGNINLRLGIFMLAGGIAGAIAGSLCSRIIPVIYYNKITGVIMLYLSVRMFASR